MGDSGASVHPLISIRKAGPDDLVVLTHLALLAVDEQRDSRGGAVWSRREARVDPATSLADALDTPTGSVFVGALDGEIVAYGVLALETLTDGGVLGRIEDLFVAPQARGIGLGEALMAAIVESAEEAGCFGLDALVLPGNRATKNFFEASGLTARAIVVHRSLG